MASLSRSTWNTYRETGAAYDVTQDGHPSAGNVWQHQIRRARFGGWQKRIKQVGNFCHAFGPVSPISEEEGEAAFATAAQSR